MPASNGAPRDPPRPAGGKSKLEIAASFLQALVIAGATLYFSDRVSNAIKREQLDLEQVKGMRELLLDLQGERLTLARARADAAGLAAFGPHAIVPFVNLIQDGGVNQVAAANAGLRTLALSHPQPVADQLERVVRNRSRFYVWEMHLCAIQMLGEMRWEKARPWLAEYARRLPADSASDGAADSAAWAALREVVRPQPNLELRNAIDIRAALRVATRTLVGP